MFWVVNICMELSVNIVKSVGKRYIKKQFSSELESENYLLLCAQTLSACVTEKSVFFIIV